MVTLSQLSSFFTKVEGVEDASSLSPVVSSLATRGCMGVHFGLGLYRIIQRATPASDMRDEKYYAIKKSSLFVQTALKNVGPQFSLLSLFATVFTVNPSFAILSPS